MIPFADLLPPALNGLFAPVLAWTAIAALALVALGRAHRLAPALHVGLRTALLLVLPLGLALALAVEVTLPVLPPEVPTPAPAVPETMAVEEPPALVQGPAPAPAPESSPALPPQAEGRDWTWLLLLVVLAPVAIALLRLTRDAWALRRFRQSLRPADTEAWGIDVAGVLRESSVAAWRVRFAETDADGVPLTFGWRRPVVVVPAALVRQPAELRLALLHELAHVRRGDYAWRWVERVAAVPVAWHPLVHALRRGADRYRELACDAEVLRRPGVCQKAYAALLLRVVAAPAPALPAIGMARFATDLKARVAAMRTASEPVQTVWAASLAAALLIGATTLMLLGDAELVPRRPAAPSADLAPGEATLAIAGGRLILDGEPIGGTFSIERAEEAERAFLIVQQPYRALFRFSARPLEGARPLGWVEGDELRFTAAGTDVRIVSEAPIMAARGPERVPLYVRATKPLPEGTSVNINLDQMFAIEGESVAPQGGYEVFIGAYEDLWLSASSASEDEPSPGPYRAGLAQGLMQSTLQEVTSNGARLFETLGCQSCHSTDGSRRVGPTVQGLYGRLRPLASGDVAQADEGYLRTAILDPSEHIAAGFPDLMPDNYDALPRAQLDALIEYIQSLSPAHLPGTAGSAYGARAGDSERPVVLVRLVDFAIYVDGVRVATDERAFDDRSGQLVLFTPESGLVLFSPYPFPGAERTGTMSGSEIRFEAGGHRIRLVSAEPVSDRDPLPVYARAVVGFSERLLAGISSSTLRRRMTGGWLFSGGDRTRNHVIGSTRDVEALLALREPGAALLRLDVERLVIEGEEVKVNLPEGYTDSPMGYVALLIPGHGRLVFSGVSFSGARDLAFVAEPTQLETRDTPIALGPRDVPFTDLHIETRRPILSYDYLQPPYGRPRLFFRHDPDVRVDRPGVVTGTDVALLD